MMMVSFRLSEEWDPDLIQSINQIPKRDRSRICRDAIRSFLSPGSVSAPKIKLELTKDDKRMGEMNLDEKLDKTLSWF
jgi:predicted transcriptional regulator